MEYSISLDQAGYATSIVAKYMDNVTVRNIGKFYKTTLSYNLIFTKNDASTSYEQINILSREFNIH